MLGSGSAEVKPNGMNMSPAVVLEHRGPALWARLSRPEHGNACGPEAIAGLHAWLAAGAADPDVRVLVLTGSGRSFCAGADMRAGAPLLDDRPALLRHLRHGRDLVDAIAAAPRPVIAAVNGVAAAGGFELTLAADVVVAARGARLGDAHARHGIVPGWGSSARLPGLIGPRAAARILLDGRLRSAEAMCELGLVGEVVADDELEAAVDRIVAELAAVDPTTSARVLALTRAAGRATLADDLEREWQALSAHVQAPGFAAAVRRFLGD